jgi:4-diphosphocytidyl-2-C-methyl-D-erythritol kinase
MTGSGSAVFAHWLHKADLDGAQVVFKAPVGMQARLCSSLDVHPLLGWADSDGKMTV